MFKHVIQQQSRIGWKQMLYGRFSTKWIYLFEIHNTSTQKKYKDGERWLTELILIIWTNLRYRWNLRNNIVHDETKSTSARARAQQLEISHLYANQHQFSSQCQPLFKTPLSHLLQKPRQTISSWLDHNLPFLWRNRITPSMSQRSLTSNTSQTQHRFNSCENNENSKPPPTTTLTPIRLRSERVSSPQAIPNDTSC